MQSKEPRPLKELKGFDKVYLKAGESKQIEIGLSEDAFQYFNAKQNRWVFEKGEFVGNLDTDTLTVYNDMWNKLKQ